MIRTAINTSPMNRWRSVFDIVRMSLGILGEGPLVQCFYQPRRKDDMDEDIRGPHDVPLSPHPVPRGRSMHNAGGECQGVALESHYGVFGAPPRELGRDARVPYRRAGGR